MASGLYDPGYEHDACGVGMVADLHGRPDHDIVDKGLTVLERLAHRGASGADTPGCGRFALTRSSLVIFAVLGHIRGIGRPTGVGPIWPRA